LEGKAVPTLEFQKAKDALQPVAARTVDMCSKLSKLSVYEAIATVPGAVNSSILTEWIADDNSPWVRFVKYFLFFWRAYVYVNWFRLEASLQTSTGGPRPRTGADFLELRGWICVAWGPT